MKVWVEHQVPFHDVDSLKVVWHGHYYKYFELARTALYRSVNLDVDTLETLGYSLPVIESQCRYSRPLQYAQRFEIGAVFSAWDYYIHVRYEIRLAGETRRRVYGETKQAVCEGLMGKMLLAVPTALVSRIDG